MERSYMYHFNKQTYTQRPLRPRRGDVDAVLAQVIGEHACDALAEGDVDGLAGAVDVDRHPLGPGELDREHLDARQGLFDLAADLALQCPLLVVHARHLWCVLLTKNGRHAPTSPSR